MIKVMKLFVIFLLFLQQSAFAYVHIVSRHETLSELCYRLVPGRVYGPKGSLEKVAQMNPQIKILDLVYPGQKILFPVEEPRQEFVTEQNLKEEKAEEENSKVISSSSGPEWAPSSRLSVLFGQEFFDIHAEDKKTKARADFASTASPRLDFIWEISWTKDYISRIFFSHVNESIQGDSSSGKALKKGKGGRNSFGAEVLKQVSRKTSYGIYAARSTRSFSRATDNTTLTFDRISGFELGVKAEKRLLEISKALLTGNVKLGWLAPTEGAGYAVESGKAATVGLHLRHVLKKVTLEAQTYYGYWQQDSKYTQQDSAQIGMGVGASWRFDE
jgi:hypothetical protein